MKRVGFVGLGDMGMAMAKNIVAAGFPLIGFDLRPERLDALERVGGRRAASVGEVGENADAVFVMVLNGEQVKEVVIGPDGIAETMSVGSTIVVSATITPEEVRDVGAAAAAKGLHVIDTPVSGGRSGAEAGTLTLMAAGSNETLDANRDLLEAVGSRIFHVGEDVGTGQTVKACLQALIGTIFAGVFESLVLSAKAGIKGKTMYDVVSSSSIGCPLIENSMKLVMERQFKGTGSQITTMHKDLGISMSLARETGVPMFTASAAAELFRAGISSFPDEDNWTIVKVLEQIAGTEVTW